MECIFSWMWRVEFAFAYIYITAHPSNFQLIKYTQQQMHLYSLVTTDDDFFLCDAHTISIIHMHTAYMNVAFSSSNSYWKWFVHPLLIYYDDSSNQLANNTQIINYSKITYIYLVYKVIGRNHYLFALWERWIECVVCIYCIRTRATAAGNQVRCYVERIWKRCVVVNTYHIRIIELWTVDDWLCAILPVKFQKKKL